jgi:DNA polymerase-3 subunit alpha
MHGESPIEYRHPALEPIFGDTYGIPIYQEQIMRAAVELAGYSASDSDELRSAISKKKAKEIVKHHVKFVDGAVAKGMPRETAESIFADWEEFARYGFNRAHAADYGFLAVQTAYLKYHYPAEYMSALLTVSKHETEKVALYANDARLMGVEILPPDVNSSEWNFKISDHEGKARIRFGMGAIKNVGAASCDLVVNARAKGGPFRDLNDFARRVDLRPVGKRALECLIKVGAMDQFGLRAAMLEGLDQIVSVSASHFRAEQAGQMSLFGTHTGVTESILLPLVPEADRREKLNWERELIGMYISEHPLAAYMEEIRRVVSHYASTLGEAGHEERTRVAGMISGIRPHQTKTGKMMAWVTLEDQTGVIELVVFPRTWERFQFALEVGGVIVVEGKVDANSSPPKVLVDNIQTQIKVTEAAQLPLQPKPISRDQSQPPRQKPLQGNLPPAHQAPAPPPSQAHKRVTEKQAKYKGSSPRSKGTGGEAPPPPEDPPGWETDIPGFINPLDFSPDEESARMTSPELIGTEPAQDHAEPSTGNRKIGLPSTASVQESPGPEAVRSSGIPSAAQTDQPPDMAPVVLFPLHEKVASRVQIPGTGEGQPPQMLTVILRSTGDAERDIRRISRLHGAFISFPGRDRFQFQIFEDGKGHLIDFPNDTTRCCPELLKMVKEFVGNENLQVEPITYL